MGYDEDPEHGWRLVKRQRVQTDAPTGRLIHYYVDIGPGRARPRSDKVNTGMQIGGSKAPPVEGIVVKTMR